MFSKEREQTDRQKKPDKLIAGSFKKKLLEDLDYRSHLADEIYIERCLGNEQKTVQVFVLSSKRLLKLFFYRSRLYTLHYSPQCCCEILKEDDKKRETEGNMHVCSRLSEVSADLVELQQWDGQVGPPRVSGRCQ